MRISDWSSDVCSSDLGFQFLPLAKVGGEGHDLATIGLLQPFQDDAGVQTARKGQHHLVDRTRSHRLLPESSTNCAAPCHCTTACSSAIQDIPSIQRISVDRKSTRLNSSH